MANAVNVNYLPLVSIDGWKALPVKEEKAKEDEQPVCGVCLCSFSENDLPYGHEIVSSIGLKSISHLNHKNCWQVWATQSAGHRIVDDSHFGIDCPSCKAPVSIEVSKITIQAYRVAQRIVDRREEVDEREAIPKDMIWASVLQMGCATIGLLSFMLLEEIFGGGSSVATAGIIGATYCVALGVALNKYFSFHRAFFR